MTHRLTSGRIRSITRHIYDLPTLPTTVARMIEVIDQPSTSASTLAKIISSDQVLTAQILKLANSAYYGFPRRINTITLAIVVLGFETLKNLVLSVSVIDGFSRYQHSMPFDVHLFWEHAIATGLGSRMIAREAGYQIAGEAFAAGLLHDIGKYVMSLHFKTSFERIVNRMIDEDLPMFVIEEQELDGVNHAHVGAWLIEKWNLPEQIVQAVQFHHNLDQRESGEKLAAIIHFADYLAKKLGVGYSGDMSTPSFDEDVIPELGLKKDGNGRLKEAEYLERFKQEIEAEHSLFAVARHHQEFAQSPKLPASLHRRNYATTEDTFSEH